jgi:hypothetical protein
VLAARVAAVDAAAGQLTRKLHIALDGVGVTKQPMDHLVGLVIVQGLAVGEPLTVGQSQLLHRNRLPRRIGQLRLSRQPDLTVAAIGWQVGGELGAVKRAARCDEADLEAVAVAGVEPHGCWSAS